MTDSTSTFADREAWLIEAANAIALTLFTPNAIHLQMEQTRLSCGFPPGRRGGQKHVVAGVCFPRARSTDAVNEVFISPLIDDVSVILPTLVHELLHAVDDCVSGHGAAFGAMARRVGLVGPLTATMPSPELAANLRDLADALGDYPHARITMTGATKQGTRLLKLECDACGAIWRMSAKWADQVQFCPCCSSSNVTHH